jgi:tetratricopeptide (TPR) repeat protein
MPVSGSTDIPHVSVHDHYIRKPITQKEKNSIKEFLGLFSVNESSPDALTRAQAYIDQYAKFEQNAFYLDSALRILNSITDKNKTVHHRIQLHFIKGEYEKIVSLVKEIGEQKCLDNLFVDQSYDNKDAWTIYRVAESYSNVGNDANALKWFRQAVKLAPYNLDYRNKLGSALASNNQLKEAIAEFEYIISENPKYVSAYSNLGYIRMIQGSPAEALRLYNIGKKLDPDNEALLLNLAGYYLYNKETKIAREYLESIVKKNPHNKKATEVLKRI